MLPIAIYIFRMQKWISSNLLVFKQKKNFEYVNMANSTHIFIIDDHFWARMSLFVLIVHNFKQEYYCFVMLGRFILRFIHKIEKKKLYQMTLKWYRKADFIAYFQSLKKRQCLSLCLLFISHGTDEVRRGLFFYVSECTLEHL